MNPPVSVFEAYALRPTTAEAITIGNINQTYRVVAGDNTYILQRLSPLVDPNVHHDIVAVTRHLESRGQKTPKLVRAVNGDLWTTDADGGVWRLQNYVQGEIHSIASSKTIARAAGLLLGQFHRHVSDLAWVFQSVRTMHDTERHLRHLREVLEMSPDQPGLSDAKRIGEAIVKRAGALSQAPAYPKRIVHGDPKLNNLVFSSEGYGICLIDLDTLGRGELPLELGDAFRSWCNPVGEDSKDAHLDIQFFEAALAGYVAGADGLLTPIEAEGIVGAVERIALELAARFCADIVEQTYFAWDQDQYESAWQHHTLRAQAQLNFALSAARQRERIEKIVQGIVRLI